jgi:hypothetical protein
MKVVQGGAPAHQLLPVRALPEPGHEGADQQLLGNAHARVRRHLEGAELDEAQPPHRPLGRVELVDADLRPMGIAGGVNQKVAEQAVDEPGRHLGAVRLGDLRERDLQLVEGLVARLVHARGLAGRPDELAGEQVAERGVVLPIGDHARQEVRAAQKRAVRRCHAAEHDVVAAAGAEVPAVEPEFFRAEADAGGLLVDRRRDGDGLLPGGRRMHVDLDDAGVGCHLDASETGIVGGA